MNIRIYQGIYQLHYNTYLINIRHVNCYVKQENT